MEKIYYKQLEEKLLKKYQAIWTHWMPIDNYKMRKVRDIRIKSFLKLLIADAYLGGLNKGGQIIKKS